MTMERCTCVALTLVGLVALAQGWQLGLWQFGAPGAGLFPFVSGALLSITSLAGLFGTQGSPQRADWPRVLCYGLAMGGFLILLEPMGFLIAAFVLLICVFLVLERMPLWRGLTLSICLSSASWVLFHVLLSVPLPNGSAWL
jgi:putative tricarboxylic transport membrane protein